MTSNEFRKQLMKIMPKYAWTIHRSFHAKNYLSATGIQSSGFNRLSTLQVVRREKDDKIEYEVKSAGFGRRTPWLSTYTDNTLAKALRGLQDYYEIMTRTYSNHAWFLRNARKKRNKRPVYEQTEMEEK